MISNTNEYELYIKHDFSNLKTSYPFPQYPSNIILVVSSLFNITHRIHGTYIVHKKTPNVVRHTIHFAHLAYSLLTPKKKAIPQKRSWFQNDEKNLQKSHGTGIFTYIYHKNKPNVYSSTYHIHFAHLAYTLSPQKNAIPKKSSWFQKNDETKQKKKRPEE